jgi:DNA-binding NtrC family response regulator
MRKSVYTDQKLDDWEGILVGKSRKVAELREQIQRASRSDDSVLISGETGTGDKEFVAGMVHHNSSRSHGPFTSLCMCSLPSAYLEPEMLGWENGGHGFATKRRVGKLVQADGGTIYLNALGELPANLQDRLMKVLEEKRVYPIGATRPVDLDVRIISGTYPGSFNVEEMIRKGKFRPDLYERLSVIEVRLPPLRERSEDLPDLVQGFLNWLNDSTERRVEGITPEALDYLKEQEWPGNIRQLRGWILTTALNADRLITLKDIVALRH